MKERREGETGFGGFEREREENCSCKGCKRGKGGPPREAGGGVEVVDEGSGVLGEEERGRGGGGDEVGGGWNGGVVARVGDRYG